MVGLVFIIRLRSAFLFLTSTAHMCANKRARRSSTSVRNIAMLFVPGTLMTAIRRHNCSLFVSFRFSSVGRKLVASCANSNVCSSRLLCNSSRMPFLRSVVCERWISRSSLDNRRISSCSILANLSIQYASTWTKGALDRAAASWTITGAVSYTHLSLPTIYSV